MSKIESLLDDSNFGEELKKLAKEYKNKKVILYGAGIFLETINKKYDLNCLNIIAISDIRFLNTEIKELKDDMTSHFFSQEKEYIGYKTISPDKIFEYKPDIVLLTVEDDFYIEKFLCEKLFKKYKKKFKYRTIFNPSLSDKMQKEWENV